MSAPRCRPRCGCGDGECETCFPRLRVITLRIGEPARIESIRARGDGLAGLQEIVGGNVERVPNAYWNRPVGSGLDLFCNEEGMLRELKVQVRPELGQRAPLYGNLVLARSNPQGDTLSVTDADVALFGARP